MSLSLLVGDSALISKYTSSYGSTLELLERDGFTDIYPTHFTLEGDGQAAKTRTAGLGIIECANAFVKIAPDVVVVRGDRFEVLSAAMAAAYLNIPVAHIEGGDVSGTIDENVRHAITKLAHLHFPTHGDAARRIRAMGENLSYVFDVGSPDVEVASAFSRRKAAGFDSNETGSGARIDLSKPYLMVRFHPVWNETRDQMVAQTSMLLEAVEGSGFQALWFWSNDDTGAEYISHTLRSFNDQVPRHHIRFLRDLPPALFVSLLAPARCLIGNSSAGGKDARSSAYRWWR